jgi:hypothetical protein
LFDEDSIEDREFLRRVIEEQIIPVVKDCYALELEDRPGLTGKITVEPTIVADEEIGAVVEDAKILDDDTTIDAEDLKECVVETTLALEFSPPDEGRGRQPIAFTIAFSGDLEDE